VRAAPTPRMTGAGVAGALAVTGRLVELIERDRLPVARAAKTVGLPLEVAGMLVRLHAIELEAAETELEERLEDIQRECPGEDWFSYTDNQLTRIFSGAAIPNRIVRELVQAWQQRTGHGTGRLAARLGIGDEALRRSLGMVAVCGRGRRRRSRSMRPAESCARSESLPARCAAYEERAGVRGEP
jgi:hypothetical protein